MRRADLWQKEPGREKALLRGGAPAGVGKRNDILGPTGPFRPVLKEYMAVQAPNYYSASTLSTVRSSLAKVLRYAAQVEKFQSVEEIRPAMVTRFIAVERDRGLTSRSFVGHLSTFFAWLIAEERYHLANPVVARIHSQRGAPTEARPYEDGAIQALWAYVEHGDDMQLKLAFSIGLECGLRVGEVANIRLSDIAQIKQTIFVRLPTKNKRTRTVSFHGQVARYLKLWLQERDPACPTDHLLHNTVAHPFNQNQLDAWFKNLLGHEFEPAASFHFHRLRHTWATRLMNNGLELAVLKELGGWAKWNSMQKYIKVLPQTIRRQYEAAYAQLQEKQESGEDESISLVDFAIMDGTESATIN